MPNVKLTHEAYRHALAVRDLTDPARGGHAMQLLIAAIETALRVAWGCDLLLHRAHPVVSVADNYDRLHYPPGGAARDARYTRYVSETLLLRTHTSAMIPALLRRLAVEPPRDVLLVCPGLVYRRDQIDRLHTGEPHQLDLWRIYRGRLGVDSLRDMIACVVTAALPGRDPITAATTHPYTEHGLEIYVRDGEHRVEVGECGLASPHVLQEAGLDPRVYSGLAMGLGLDRILMMRKGVEDIRLLRSADQRVAAQMLDLERYQPVSNQPRIRRDLFGGRDTGPYAGRVG